MPPTPPPPGTRRRRYRRWRRLSTWLTLAVLLAFALAAVSFVGGLSRDEAAEVTRDLLQRLGAALGAQAVRTGRLPAHLAELQPATASEELIREDGWGRPIDYRVVDGAPRLRSLGADGVAGTADDIVWPEGARWSRR